MPSIDLPLEQLRQYKPSLYREIDFEPFWDETVAEALQQPVNAELFPYDLPARNLQCYAVRFDGYNGGRLAGWYVRPTSAGRFPGVVWYHGYGGRAARPLDMLHLAAQGICVLSMDVRGQLGHSQDSLVTNEGSAAGWMTKGIHHPRQYYFRFVYADAIRALELLAHRDEVDAQRIAVNGTSQGGALSLAVAALSEPMLALADVPVLCDFRRAVAITPAGPYPEIARYLQVHPRMHEQTFRTLSYVDCINLAPWIKARTVIGCSLCDDICPPSTVFAAYHHLGGEKQIEVYPFHPHEVPHEHLELKYRTIVEVLGV